MKIKMVLILAALAVVPPLSYAGGTLHKCRSFLRAARLNSITKFSIKVVSTSPSVTAALRDSQTLAGFENATTVAEDPSNPFLISIRPDHHDKNSYVELTLSSDQRKTFRKEVNVGHVVMSLREHDLLRLDDLHAKLRFVFHFQTNAPAKGQDYESDSNPRPNVLIAMRGFEAFWHKDWNRPFLFSSFDRGGDMKCAVRINGSQGTLIVEVGETESGTFLRAYKYFVKIVKALEQNSPGAFARNNTLPTFPHTVEGNLLVLDSPLGVLTFDVP